MTGVFSYGLWLWAPGGWELVVIVITILLLFGAKRIPELARGLGRGIREFKDATKDINREIEQTGTPQAGAPQAGTQQPQQPPPNTAPNVAPNAAPPATPPANSGT